MANPHKIEAMGICSTKTVISKYHLPLKGIRAPWKSGHPQIWRGNVLYYQEVRKPLNTSEVMSRGHRTNCMDSHQLKTDEYTKIVNTHQIMIPQRKDFL